MSDNEMRNLVEILILAAKEPITANRLAEIIGGNVESNVILQMIDELNIEYEQNGKKYRIKNIAGGFQFRNTDDVAQYIASLLHNKNKLYLSKAALEVLSIIIFKQPITRPEINKLRGVNSDGIVAMLLDKHLIKIVGKSKELGRALLFGIDKNLLIKLGLNSEEDIPKLKEMREIIANLEKSNEENSMESTIENGS